MFHLDDNIAMADVSANHRIFFGHKIYRLYSFTLTI